MPEGRVPISSSRIATGDIARHSFAVVRRGFDTDEVRAYLQSISRNLEELEEREQELRNQLAEAEEHAAHPVVDEATLTSSLGQHSAQIIRHAHEEATRIVTEAQESATALLRDSQSQAEELQMRTETSTADRVVEVERLVASAEQEAREESERIVAAAVAQAEDLVARAKDEGRTLLEQVQEARRRVLADLASKRRSIGMQIEQLRAARDEMAASVHGVRDKVDTILTHLDRTDDEARAAALAVGDQLRVHGGSDEPLDQDTWETEGGASAGAGGSASGGAAESVAAGRAPASKTEVAGEDEEGAGVAPSVDELFARIRAGSEGDTRPADASAPTEAVPVTQSESASKSEAPEVPSAAAGPDAELIARRDELLGPVTAKLSRAVKRALGDDQNRLLDQMRSAPSREATTCSGPRTSTWPCTPARPRCAGGGVRRRCDVRRNRGGGGARGRDRDVVERVGPQRGDDAAAAHRGGERRCGRPGRRGVPGVARRAGGAAGGRLRHGRLLGRRGGGGRGRPQGALGGHVERRVLGLRGQRAGGRGERGGGVPDGTRPPAGARGLPLPGSAGRRLRAGLTFAETPAERRREPMWVVPGRFVADLAVFAG